jgi:hypothetical protein
MKNTISFLIATMVVICLFSGCKKYEDGPDFTLRSVKNRLTNGKWGLDKITIDGQDSTYEYKEVDFNYEFYTGTAFGAKPYTYSQAYTYNSQLIQIDNGDVIFTNNGNTISFQPYSSTYGSYSSYSPIFGSDSYGNYLEWDITKLTNKEFWLETVIRTDSSSMKVVMHLTKN